jgi:hypothetical protein
VAKIESEKRPPEISKKNLPKIQLNGKNTGFFPKFDDFFEKMTTI